MSSNETGALGTKAASRTGAKKEVASGGKPDAQAYQEKLAAVNKAIQENKENLKLVRDKINLSTGERQDFLARKQELRTHMDELQSQIDALEQERKEVMASMEELKQSGQRMKSELSAMKKTMEYTTERQFDQKIEEIENMMMTTSLPLKEEKRLLQQIQQLKLNKKAVEKYAIMEASAKTGESTTVVPLKIRLDHINEELRNLRNKKKQDSEKFKQLLSEQQNQSGPIKELWEERNKYRRILDELIATRRQHHDAYNAALRQWQNHQNQLRLAKNEKIREEKMKRAVEQQRQSISRQLEKMDTLPYENQVLLLEQTMAYVKKLMEDRESRMMGQEHQNTTAKWVAEAFAGEGEALAPKALRADEFGFTPKKTANRKHAANSVKKHGKTHTYRHDISTLYYFEQCKVPAPVTDDDLEECLSKLQKEFDMYRAMQAEELEKHKEKRKALEAQLEALDLSSKKEDLFITPIEEGGSGEINQEIPQAVH